MLIKRLEFENFRSYESAALDLAHRGLVLVEGINGAGKSSWVSAVCWALYGRCPDGLKADDVVRHGQRGCRVYLLLDINGQEVEVTRYRKHPEFSNQLHLTIDGADSRGPTDKETQERLERILQLDWNSFISVVVFPQGAQGIASWTDAEQKSVLSTVLDLERFSAAQERASAWIAKDQERLTRLESSLRELNSAQEVAEENFVRLLQQEASFGQEKALRIEALEVRRAEVRSQEPQSAEPFQKRLEELQRQLEESRQDDVIEIVRQVEHRLNEARSEQREAAARIKMLDRNLQDLTTVDPDKEVAKHQDCPSCGQLLPEDARSRLRCSYEEQNARIRERQAALIADKHETERLMQERDGSIFKLMDLLERSRAQLVDTSDLENSVREAEQAVRNAHARWNQWKSQLDQVNYALTAEQERTNPYRELIKANETQIAARREKIELAEREIGPLRDDLEHLRFWKIGFGGQGVRSLLLSTITPYLNERANVYMGELTGGQANIQISTQTQLRSGEFRDKLSFAVTYPGGPDTYQGKSGGEKRRADLAILFALGDLAASRARSPVRLALLDEVFDSLDAPGCERVVALLTKYIVPRAGTVLVLSHNEALKALIEQRLLVVKEHGVSRIENG